MPVNSCPTIVSMLHWHNHWPPIAQMLFSKTNRAGNTNKYLVDRLHLISGKTERALMTHDALHLNLNQTWYAAYQARRCRSQLTTIEGRWSAFKGCECVCRQLAQQSQVWTLGQLGSFGRWRQQLPPNDASCVVLLPTRVLEGGGGGLVGGDSLSGSLRIIGGFKDFLFDGRPQCLGATKFAEFVVADAFTLLHTELWGAGGGGWVIYTWKCWLAWYHTLVEILHGGREIGRLRLIHITARFSLSTNKESTRERENGCASGQARCQP